MAQVPAATASLLPLRLGDDTAACPLQQPATRVQVIDTTAVSEPIHGLGSGDTSYYPAFLSRQEADDVFARLQAGAGEVQYQQWYHMPNLSHPTRPLEPLRRIKCAFANPTADNLVPLYRFPVNDQRRYGEVVPMPPTIDMLRRRAEELTGHHYNHSVVLLYRDAEDTIGLHRDKTLDLTPGAPIVSIALGAERPYVLRDGVFKATTQQELLFRHGGMVALGYDTNEKFYHSVRKLTPDEEAAMPPDGRVRISVTFRSVATFKDANGVVSGLGAAYQTLNWPIELNGAHHLDDNLDQPLPPAAASSGSDDGEASKDSETERVMVARAPRALPARECVALVNSCAAELDVTAALVAHGTKATKQLLHDAVLARAEQLGLLSQGDVGLAERELLTQVSKTIAEHYRASMLKQQQQQPQ